MTRAYIQQRVNELSCNTLGCDDETLFAKYEGDTIYAGMLSGFAEAVFGSVDALPICIKDGE